MYGTAGRYFELQRAYKNILIEAQAAARGHARTAGRPCAGTRARSFVVVSRLIFFFLR